MEEYKVSIVNVDGFTSCCDALTTISIAIGEPVECCKVCWNEVVYQGNPVVIEWIPEN